MFSINAPCREVPRKTLHVILKFGRTDSRQGGRGLANAEVIWGCSLNAALTVADKKGEGMKMAKNLLT